ncbi:MAG: AbrB/MazE/SpoVT family DNA-binding domain-containing protein [Spongiibacteraceae bacterium]
MQVCKWGNSLALRLPVAIVEALEIKEGDNIEIVVTESRKFEVRKSPGVHDLLQKLKKFRGKLPADFKFDRDELSEGR